MGRILISLRRVEVIDAIKNLAVVNYRSGVWNSYQKVPVQKAIEAIQKSGYGADLYDINGEYCVSIPSDGDMF